MKKQKKTALPIKETGLRPPKTTERSVVGRYRVGQEAFKVMVWQGMDRRFSVINLTKKWEVYFRIGCGGKLEQIFTKGYPRAKSKMTKRNLAALWRFLGQKNESFQDLPNLHAIEFIWNLLNWKEFLKTEDFSSLAGDRSVFKGRWIKRFRFMADHLGF